jgi:hypothetical protein
MASQKVMADPADRNTSVFSAKPKALNENPGLQATIKTRFSISYV